MEISQNTQEMMAVLDEFSKGNLRKKEDIELIIEICSSYQNGFDTLQKLLFGAKQLWNVSQTLKKVEPSQTGVELLHKEFELQLETMKSEMQLVYGFLDKAMQERWETVYFQLTKGCVLNILDLAHDLGLLKDMISSAKTHRN